MTNEEIDTITDLLFGNGYDMLKTINDLSNKLKEKDKEIKRLNNIIDETIKDIEHSALWLGDKQVELKNTPFGKRILEKLKEGK